jgi:hypothetical protein
MDLTEFRKEVKDVIKTGNGPKITKALLEYYRLKRENGQEVIFKTNSKLWNK